MLGLYAEVVVTWHAIIPVLQGNQIRAKKDELKASGLSGKKCDAHPEAETPNPS